MIILSQIKKRFIQFITISFFCFSYLIYRCTGGIFEGDTQLKNFILVANHVTNFEGPIIWGYFYFKKGISISFMAKQWLFDHITLGPMFRSVGFFNTNSLSDLKRVLRCNGPIGLFPEGTRSGNGIMGDFHNGAQKIAKKNGNEILPIAVKGFENLSWFLFCPLFKNCTIKILEPTFNNLDKAMNSIQHEIGAETTLNPPKDNSSKNL